MPRPDPARVALARRLAIRTLDDYAATQDECCAMFGVAPPTFHRYAAGFRLRCPKTRTFENPRSLAAWIDAAWTAMFHLSPRDAREIATIALLKAGFSPAEIVAALRKTSKSAVYRQWQAIRNRRGGPSPAEVRMQRRHDPAPEVSGEPPTWPLLRRSNRRSKPFRAD